MSHQDFDYLGPYKIERTLGRGGMGTVYKGYHAKSGEPAAIKVIATGIANQMRFRRRFNAEIETLKRLKHPNIVQLIGYGEEQGLLFYSMEFVQGHSLHEHLRQHGRLPWQEVVQVAIETTAALKHAHDMGIIHRDLKPANLMLNTAAHVKLTDFGVSKLFGSKDMTAAGSVIGTADYMSPEQAEGKGITARSDLYSLGGVMYALLTGSAPFGGKSLPEVLYAVRYNQVPCLLEKAPDVPKELAELVHQLLEKDANQRLPTASVVGNRLKSMQQGLQYLSVQNGNDASGEKVSMNGQVGTQLTSLDLSDVEDDELRLTGEERAPAEIENEQIEAEKAEPRDAESTEETQHSSQPLGTHEQQTLLASSGVLDELPDASEISLSDAAAADASSDAAPSRADSLARPSVADEKSTASGRSHFTPVTAGDQTPYSSLMLPEEPEVDWLHYASLAGIIGLLLASLGFAWWMLRPQSADSLYADVVAAVESGDDSQLFQARESIDEFLERFPQDDRRDEIQAISDESDLTRLARNLQRRASRGGGIDQLNAIEQGFLDCVKLMSQDSDLARQKLAAFVSVFGSIDDLPPSEKRFVALAEFALRSGARPKEDAVPEAAVQLQTLIQSAEASLSGAKLKACYQNLLTLYGDKSWAAEQMDRIRKKLETEP